MLLYLCFMWLPYGVMNKWNTGRHVWTGVSCCISKSVPAPFNESWPQLSTRFTNPTPQFSILPAFRLKIEKSNFDFRLLRGMRRNDVRWKWHLREIVQILNYKRLFLSHPGMARWILVIYSADVTFFYLLFNGLLQRPIISECFGPIFNQIFRIGTRMGGHNQSKLFRHRSRDVAMATDFGGESVKIGIPHLHSVRWHSKTTGMIATRMHASTPPMTPLRRIKILWPLVQ